MEGKTMMPTTRRGRFLFYRNRAMKRVRRAWARFGKDDSVVDSGSHHTGSSTIDLSGYTVQVPITDYHPEAPRVYEPSRPETFWIVKPERGVWGVANHPPAPDPLRPNSHRRDAYNAYAKRRVLSIPRLKHLPKIPSSIPFQPGKPELYWPFPTYPSGAVNVNYVPPF